LQLELLEFEPGVSSVEVTAEGERERAATHFGKEEEAQTSWPPNATPPIFPVWSE